MWPSKKFKRAAEKHYRTCLHILKNVNTLQTDSKSHIICNIYYLSGYVLECILKFYILEAEHKPKNYSFSEEELRQIGIFHHNLDTLWIKTKDKGVNYKDIQWTSLSKQWDVYVRYEVDVTEYKDEALVRQHFFKTVEPIYNKIKELY